MKILHVIPGLTYERGGPSAVVQALTRHQSAAGHEVAVLTTLQGARHGEHPVELSGAVMVDRVKVRGPDRLAYAPAFRAAVRDRLRSTDLVHIHSVFTYPVHVALQEALAGGVPAIVRPCGHLHAYSLRRSAWRKRAYLAAWGPMIRRACAAWHYTSEDEAANSWPEGQRSHFVLPNGVEPAEFAVDREEARALVQRSWPDLDGAPYVLFLGRLHPKKRLDLLLEAFLAAAPRPYKLIVAGPDEANLWPTLAARCLHETATARRVLRVGTVGGNSRAALLAGASLFALPSEHENFGIAALEALAAGTPVLLSPHVDLASAVVPAGIGFTAPLDAAAWRERLATLLGDASMLRQSGELARLWVERHHAWSTLVTELTRHYRRLGVGVDEGSVRRR